MSTPSATSISSFASLVHIPDGVEKWKMLDDSEPLAQLHKMFWGKTMAEEKESTHQSTSDPSNNNQKPDGESDYDTDESEDDDISSSCYVLNIDNKAIKIQRIWVRVSAFTGVK
jgi:hypothetical protein